MVCIARVLVDNCALAACDILDYSDVVRGLFCSLRKKMFLSSSVLRIRGLGTFVRFAQRGRPSSKGKTTGPLMPNQAPPAVPIRKLNPTSSQSLQDTVPVVRYIHSALITIERRLYWRA